MDAYLLFLALLLPGPPPAYAAGISAPTSHVQAELIAEQESIKPGEIFTVAIYLRMKEGWHTYWRNPGDSGLSTSLQWRLPAGFKAADVDWPYPDRFATPDSASYGYRDDAALLSKLSAPVQLPQGSSVDVSVKVKWLECREICVPGHAELSVRLPVLTSQPRSDPAVTRIFAQARQRIPQALGTGIFKGWSAQAFHNRGKIRLRLTPSPTNELSQADIVAVEFFPYDDGIIANDQPQHAKADGRSLVLDMALSRAPGADKALKLSGVLVFKHRNQAIEISVPIKEPSMRRKLA